MLTLKLLLETRLWEDAIKLVKVAGNQVHDTDVGALCLQLAAASL